MGALAENDDLATYLGEEINAEQATQALEIASGIIRDYCGWNITQETATWRLAAAGAPMLLLPSLKINSVQTVAVAGENVTDFELDDSGILWRSNRWGAGVVTVTVDHGYPAAPSSVLGVVLQIAGRLIVNPTSMRSISARSTSEVYAYAEGASLLPHERQVLDRYRVTLP